MLVLLPACALVTCVLVGRAHAADWREAIVGGAVVWGTALVGISEGLSLFHALSTPWIAGAWLVITLAGGVYLARHHRWTYISSRPVCELDAVGLGLLAPLGAIFLTLGLIGVISPPNTWDSMTYHMARLIHWIENSSLAPYPTHIVRQLYMQPGAELALLHLQLLSGGDYLAGLVQWFSAIGAALGASLIANEFGATRRGAVLASIFAVSSPIGVLEATSTQNDWVVSFWLVCTLVYAIRIVRSTSLRWPTVLAFGASLGLALVTKATAYLIALPIIIGITIALVRRCRIRGLQLLVAIGLLAMAMNAGVYVRNLNVFGSPLGPPDEGAPSLRYLNEALTLQLLASNVVRDIGLNLVATPSPSINVRSFQLIQAVHQWLGVNLNDPRTTWGEETFAERPVGLAFDENFAGNPVQLLLLLLACAALWPLRHRLAAATWPYVLSLAVGFLLFAAILRWQPWHTRLELSFFVLSAPLVATVVESFVPRLAVPVAAALLVSMLPWVVYNQARPVVGPRSILAVSRPNQYFTNQPALRSPYLSAIELLDTQQCTDVGFIATADGWEYPLWALLPGVHIEHVGVTNASASLTRSRPDGFKPCAVVSIGPDATSSSIQLGGQTYLPHRWALQQVAVLTVDGD